MTSLPPPRNHPLALPRTGANTAPIETPPPLPKRRVLVFLPGLKPGCFQTLLPGQNFAPILRKFFNHRARVDLTHQIIWTHYRLLHVQCRMIDHFTGLAVPMAAEITEAMRDPSDRVAVIANPSLGALEAVAPARALAAHRRYIAVGRLMPQKNYPLLVRAFALAAAPGDTLAIIGEGSERGPLELLVAERDLQDSVSLPGHIDVAPALAAADVFVLSSDHEGHPGSVVAALASGLPVVATDCSLSMHRLIGKFGSLVPRGNITALAKAMQAQPPLSATDRRAAYFAMQAYTVERAARLYGDVFARLSKKWHPGNATLRGMATDCQ